MYTPIYVQNNNETNTRPFLYSSVVINPIISKIGMQANVIIVINFPIGSILLPPHFL